MTDQVSRLLEAIGQAKHNAEAVTHMHWIFPKTSRMNGRTVLAEYFERNDPASVLRRCAADRDIVEWCQEVIGERDLSRYGQDGLLKDDPQALAVTLAMETLRNLERAYGISAEEETTGE